MASNRKYTPEEIDYVHARIDAGWNFDIIAKAFKIHFAPHWANKIVTKKQIQYIKSSYKRAPGYVYNSPCTCSGQEKKTLPVLTNPTHRSTIKPYDGPIPIFPSSPTPSATGSTTMDHKDINQPAYRDPTDGFMPGPSHPPANAGGEAQYVSPYPQIAAPSDSAFQHSSPSAYPALALDQPSESGNSYMIDPFLLEHYNSSSYGKNNSNSYHQQQPNNPTTTTNVGTQPQPKQPQQQQQRQSSPTPGSTYRAWTPGTDNHEIDARYSGYGSRLDNDPIVGIPSLQNGVLNSAGPNLQGVGGQQQQQQQQQQPLPSNADADHDNHNYNFDFDLPSSSAAGHPPSPPECTPERMVDADEHGWWYTEAHDACNISVEHRHNFDGVVGFRNIYAYHYNVQVLVDGLLGSIGLRYDPVGMRIMLPLGENVVSNEPAVQQQEE